MYEFEFRTGRLIIDDDKCSGCETKACVAACTLYGREILEIKDGKPRLVTDDANQRCIEDLGCEYECWARGEGAIRIELPIPGLEEYQKKVGTA